MSEQRRVCGKCASEIVFDQDDGIEHGDQYSTGHCECPTAAYCSYPLWMVWSMEPYWWRK